MIVCAVASQKSGVGKTTTAINISVLLARQGQRVLIVETDPQFALTRQLGIEVRSLDVNLVDVLAGRALVQDAIVADVHCVDVIPGRSTAFYEYRLWRSDPRIRFRGVIHEQVVDAIHRVGAEDGRSVANWSGLALDHVGYEGDQTAKHKRNLPLLRRQLAVHPTNMFNWCHLSRVLLGRGDPDGAERALERAVERAVALARRETTPKFHAATQGSIAWGDLVRLRYERDADVTELLAEGRTRWPEQWQLVWIEGQIHLDHGRLEEAESCFRKLIEVDLGRLPEAGISYDERLFGVYAQSSLGLALFRLGRYPEAAEAYAAAERLEPHEQEHTVKRILDESRARSSVPSQAATYNLLPARPARRRALDSARPAEAWSSPAARVRLPQSVGAEAVARPLTPITVPLRNGLGTRSLAPGPNLLAATQQHR